MCVKEGKMKIPVLGVILGDAAGIGPEIVCKMLYAGNWKGNYTPIIIGNEYVFNLGMKYAGVNLKYEKYSKAEGLNQLSNTIILFDNNQFDPGKIEMGTISNQSGISIIEMIKAAVKLKKANLIDGIIYAPINKNAINLADSSFTDELHVFKHFSDFDGLCLEMNYACNLWTTRVTGHIPLMKVSSYLSINSILDVVRLTNQILRITGIKAPRLYAAALNPHGGEGGLFGSEEEKIITPAIKQANLEGINIKGPFPADTIFNRAFSGECDAVVTMYHDQGQIALKTKCFGEGITLMAGLPFISATPGHGVGYDIAGKGIANEMSIQNAVKIALQMIRG
jgi:4-phospho-D-threonate 3-dehydrogenase / 4-phospho-D-erythronate 3-dehydrogenase